MKRKVPPPPWLRGSFIDTEGNVHHFEPKRATIWMSGMEAVVLEADWPATHAGDLQYFVAISESFNGQAQYTQSVKIKGTPRVGDTITLRLWLHLDTIEGVTVT